MNQSVTVDTAAVELEPQWKQQLVAEFNKPYFAQLKAFLIEEKRQGIRIYPPGKDIFNAFWLTPFSQVKVVILGQDPYHGANQAHGLAFSVKPGVALPPSLQNIFKELQDDLALPIPQNGDLTAWAKQGVFLLNTCLTVRAGQAHTHRDKGWELFTDAVIKLLSNQHQRLIFVLWGAPAKAKQVLIDTSKHLVLTATHPSPLSAYRGFMGCGHFSKINQALTNAGQTAIDWRLPD